MERIGILGGTFDPVHIAHLMIAEAARSEFDLDRVYLMPTGKSPHKDEDTLTPKEDRAAMISLAIADNPYLHLSRFEMDAGETSYTYRTAERLSEKYPEDDFYYIMGADSLIFFENWRHPEIIAKHFHLIAAERDESGRETLLRLSEKYRERFQAEVRLLKVPNFSISSTYIRERIRNGQSIRYLTPDPVITYIRERGLYGAGNYQNP